MVRLNPDRVDHSNSRSNIAALQSSGAQGDDWETTDAVPARRALRAILSAFAAKPRVHRAPAAGPGPGAYDWSLTK